MKALFLICALAAAQAATLNVGAGQTYATIQAASDAAQPGDTVYVYNGTYAGWRITAAAGHVDGTAAAPITYLAQSSSVQITTPNSDGNGVTVNLIDYVIINGFTITGMTDFGIDVVECQSCQILNNVVSNSGSSNILTGFAYGVLIQGNTSFGAGGTQHGIYVGNSARALDVPVVRGNVSYSNSGAGIQFNGDCFTMDHTGATDGVISGALVEGNLIYGNTGPGFSIINLSDSILRNNVVYNNLSAGNFKLADDGCGYGSNRNLIVNNTISSATGVAGVRIVPPGVGNVVYNNIIVSTGYKCVMDDTASNCTANLEGNYYLAGLEKTPTQAASGIFTNYAAYNLTLVPGSPAIAAGAASWNSYLAPKIDFLGNVRPFGSGYDLGAYQYNATAAAADTAAPTTPGTPTSSAITPYLIGLAWTASTDTREVLQYYIARNGAVIGFTDGGILTYADATASPGAAYSYSIQAVNGVSLASAASGSLALTMPGVGGCLNADSTWRNQQMPTETGTFQWDADVTPFVTTVNDGVLGLSQLTPNGYSSMGVAVRFNSSGNMDVRNGGVYASDLTLAYSLGSAYHLRVVVNLTAHTYSVYVTPPASTEETLAANYAFRTEQSFATGIGYTGVMDDEGSVSVCNISLAGTAVNTMRFVTVTPANGGASTVVAVTGITGAGQVMTDRPAAVTEAATSITLTEAMAGNQVHRFSSNSPITVTIPAGLPLNLAYTLMQAGTGQIHVVAGTGVTLVQRKSLSHSAGKGAPLSILNMGVQDEYFLWGDLQ